MITIPTSVRAMSHAEILADARRLQSEAAARYTAKAWRWLRTALSPNLRSAGLRAGARGPVAGAR